MKRALFSLVVLSSCGDPVEAVPPFIEVVVQDPSGFASPAVDTLRVTTSAILSGNPITDTFDVSLNGNTLPTDFVIRFSEQVRGQNVDISVEGLSSDVSVFSATGSANAGSATVEMVTEFCGDASISGLRSEQCDDGAQNSDVLPDACRSTCVSSFCGDAVIDAGELCDDGASNSGAASDACRTNCQPAFCGDGVLDSGEACDDGNNADADGCEADCSLPVCGNNILDPEDFAGALCYVENTPAGYTPNSAKIEAADMDGDGFQDVVFGQGNLVKIAFGDGAGGFSEIKTVGTVSNSTQFSISIFDFGNNGTLDILSSGVSSTTIDVLKNQGQRNFAVSTAVNIGSTAAIDHVIGDFDSDNRNDIVFSDSNGILFFSKGLQNSFNTPVIVSGFTKVGLITSLKLSDLDGDNNLDFVVTEVLSNTVDDKITVAKGAGNGAFTFTSKNLPGISTNSFLGGLINHTVVVDQNNDGIKELFVLDLDSPRTAIVLLKNDGTIDGNAQPVFRDLANQYVGAREAKIDSDFIDDIVLTSLNKTSVLLSSRGFEEVVAAPGTTQAGPIVGVDLVQDGVIDLVMSQRVFLFGE